MLCYLCFQTTLNVRKTAFVWVIAIAGLGLASAQTNSSIAQPASDSDVAKKDSGNPPSYSKAVTIAPNLSWTTGTQDQTVWGGSALFSAVHSASYCDPSTLGFGLAATASDSKTTKSGGTPTYLDSNDVKASVTSGSHSSSGSPHYFGANADFFENNSLGIGLQQTYAGQYQFDFGCIPHEKKKNHDRRVFGSIGIGAGFISQRLYETASTVDGFILPLSGQLTFLIGGGKGKPPKLIWYGLLGYVPVLTDTRAYQISSFTALQIPTGYPWLTFSLADTDLYANNAPIGHKRNYQNGSVSVMFSFPPKKSTSVTPPPSSDEQGACYGGDKLQRLYCYQGVTADACSPPNIFRAGTHCSSAGFTPAVQ
jgi:hypothetical protein